MINRDDMLELTRRMTLTRNCFSRIAGAYLDTEGNVDGTFNTHFLRLSEKDRKVNLELAKTIPFAKTNVNVKEYHFKKEDETAGSIWKFLMELKDCELKNDAILDILYEVIGERYHASGEYAILFFHGTYDIPLKAKDKENLWESEEVYQFLICAICPMQKDYELAKPECGFLFPAFSDRSSDIHGIDVFFADTEHPNHEFLDEIILHRQKK